MSVRLYGEAETGFIRAPSSVRDRPPSPYRLPVMIPRVANWTGGWFPSGIAPIFTTLLTVVFAMHRWWAWRPAKPSACDSQAVHHGAADFLHRLDSGGVQAAHEPRSCWCSSMAVRRRHHELRGVERLRREPACTCARCVVAQRRQDSVRTNFRGVPVWAVLFSMAGSLLALSSCSSPRPCIWCWSPCQVWRRWWCGSPYACAISVSGVNGRGTGTAPMNSFIVRPVSRCCVAGHRQCIGRWCSWCTR